MMIVTNMVEGEKRERNLSLRKILQFLNKFIVVIITSNNKLSFFIGSLGFLVF